MLSRNYKLIILISAIIILSSAGMGIGYFGECYVITAMAGGMPPKNFIKGWGIMNKQQKIMISFKIISIVCIVIGAIVLLVMLFNMVLYQQYLKNLYQQYVATYGIIEANHMWNDPSVQQTISQGYLKLFLDQWYFIPLLGGGIGLFKSYKLLVNEWVK